MDVATDFESEYQKIFGDFADRKLVKDDLYYSIKNEVEAKTKTAAKTKKKGKLGAADKLLPTVHETEQDQTEEKLHQEEVKRQMEKLRRIDRLKGKVEGETT